MSHSILSRRQLTQLMAAALLGSPVLGASAASRAVGKTSAALRIAVGGQASLYYLPLTAADRLGYFEEEGLHVEIQDHPGGALALQAVNSGGADLGCGAYEQLIEQQMLGRNLRSLALVGRAPQLVLVASNRFWPKKPMGTYRELRIGVSVPGSASQTFASLWLMQAGVPLDSVKFVAVGAGFDALTALRQGRVQGLCHVDPLITLLEQRNEVRILADMRTLKNAADFFGGPMPGACLYAPQSFVQRNAREVQGLVNALVHALKWMQTAGPADLARIIPMQYWLDDRAAYLTAFEKVRETLSPDGIMPGEGPATALRAIARLNAGLTARRVDLAQTYSNEWVRKAKLKYQL